MKRPNGPKKTPGNRDKTAGRSFHEVERKLNAPSLAELQQVGHFVQTDPHYATDAAPRPLPALLRDFQMLGGTFEVTGLRARTYFDDLRLRGYGGNVEIRVEPKGGLRFHQTIKIGGNKANADGTFDRNEKHGKPATLAPNLALLPKKIQKLLCDIYEVSNIKNIQLFPMITLHSQRMRLEYAPAGNQDRLIEYAHDSVRGQTCTGFVFDLYQAELEMKKGSPSILAAEAQRLTNQFNFLRVGRTSKPSPGFEKLKTQLEKKEDRAFLRERLRPDSFTVIKATRFQP